MAFFKSYSEAGLSSAPITTAGCSRCKLSRGCLHPKMEPTGQGAKGVFVLAEAPGCITGDSIIETAFRDKSLYPEGIPIKDLVGRSGFYVYSYDILNKKLAIGKVNRVWTTGKKKVFRVTYEWKFVKGKEVIVLQKSLKVTSNHPFLLKPLIPHDPFKGIQEQVDYMSIESGLKQGHSLQPFHRYNNYTYSFVGTSNKNMLKESRLLLRYKLGRELTEKEQCHHENGNKLDDSETNIVLHTIHSHSRLHTSNNNPMNNEKTRIKHKEIMNSDRYRKNMSSKMKEVLKDPVVYKNRMKQIELSKHKMKKTLKERYKEPSFYYNYLLGRSKISKCNVESVFRKKFPQEDFPPVDNHKVISIEYIGIEDVYDMEVEDYHNFAVNGIFVHNSEEDQKGTQLIGKAGQRLRRTLRGLGFDLDQDCRKSNAVCCRPPDNRTPEPGEIANCRPRVFEELKRSSPRVILAMGGSAIESLLGGRWNLDRDFSIGRWRGLRIPDYGLGGWFCPMFHPSYIEREERRNPAVRVIWERDLANALKLVGVPLPPEPKPQVKMLLGGPRLIKRELTKLAPPDRLPFVGLTPGTPEWKQCWRDHPEFQREMLAAREGRVNSPRLQWPTMNMAVDYETTGLKPYMDHHRIVSCSVATSQQEAIAWMWQDMDEECLKLFTRLMTSPHLRKIAGNLKFEDVWTRRFLGHGVSPWYWDVVLNAKTMDNRPGNSSVKFQAYNLLGVMDYDSHLRAFLRAPDSNALNNIHKIQETDLLQYNGWDAALEYGICLKQREVMGLE